MEVSTTLEELTKGLPEGALDIPSADGRGRGANIFEAEITRELEEEDLLLAPDPSQSQPVVTKSLRARHHELAKHLAMGTRNQNEIAELTGYSVSRISILKSDPAFADLVEHYEGEITEIFRDNHERLADMAKESADIILERLDENPEGFTHNQLMELVKLSADRTGNGPTSTQKVEGMIGHATLDQIQAAKERVKERQNGKTKRITQEKDIEADFTVIQTSPASSDEPLNVPSDRGLTECEVIALCSTEVPKEEAVEGSESQGEEIREPSGEATETEN